MAQNITLKDTSTNEALYPQTLMSNIYDAPAWIKTINKPSYGYGEIDYNISSTSVSGAVTVNGSTPLHVLTATGNISSISFTNEVPVDKHSCHIIITAEDDYTATLSHGSTVAISGTTYTFKCPEASDVSLDIKANGYIELDLLRIGTNIYVRGV